mmetsp:Transcript_6168/g.19655  ORF Transcript_6168/g.19655 Transcript_6168/m.19655 type:complete len:255 (-) Transcript_6168:79-843(-)
MLLPALARLAACFLALAAPLAVVSYTLLHRAHSTGTGVENVHLPSSIEGLQQNLDIFNVVAYEHPALSLLCFSLLYLLKQAFVIPGSLLLNIAAGALMGTLFGFPFVCLLTSIGACACYLISGLVGGELVAKIHHPQLRQLRTAVADARRDGRLAWFLISVRTFPFSPNWLLNVASPWFGVPLPHFALSAFVGLAPSNLVGVRAGTMLAQIRTPSDVFDGWTLFQLACLALIVAAPIVFRRRSAAVAPPAAGVS